MSFQIKAHSLLRNDTFYFKGEDIKKPIDCALVRSAFEFLSTVSLEQYNILIFEACVICF